MIGGLVTSAIAGKEQNRMRKIVVNKCYGGFGLSHGAEMEYAKRKGIKLYPFVEKRDKNGNLDFKQFEPYRGEKAFLIHYATKPLNKNGTYDEKSYYSAIREHQRDDPILVKLIEEMKEKAMYKIVVSEGEVERIISLETEKSNSSFGPDNQEFGKWRSFFIEVPKGVNNYKFSLWQALSDTIAIRFSIEKPKEWLPEAVSVSNFKLNAEEAGKITGYYELGTNQPIKLQLEGPLRLKVGARLNYDVSIEGAQKFTVIALENGKELQRATFRVGKSETAKYQNKPEVIPSSERTFYVQIPAGKHELEFQLNETMAKSAGLRFLSKAPEKYE
jgi:hypothetical protein